MTDFYFGIDVSEGLLSIARSRVKDGVFVVADIETYDFDREYDIVYACASLIHVSRDALGVVLRRVKKTLVAGGVLYVFMKHDLYRSFTRTDAYGTRTYYYYTPNEFIEIAGGGWEEVYREVNDFLDQRWFVLALRKI